MVDEGGVLKTLTPREEKVIPMRFGPGDGSERFGLPAGLPDPNRPRRG
jgi:hypothetical protein